jgi:HEAT repeat protein
MSNRFCRRVCGHFKESGMLFLSQIRRLFCIAAGAGMALVAVSASPAAAQTQVRLVPAESLIYDLKNPDPVRRQSAAHELGVARFAAATPELVALTGDPDASVRREAELSLEQIEDIRVLPGFVQFTADVEKDIRERAVTAVVNLYLPRATGPTAALAKIGNLLNPWSDEFLETIVDADVAVDPTVITALRARMTDPETKIRRSAARGLGILRAETAIPELVTAIREDRDDQVRVEGIRALRKIGNPSVADHVMPLLNFNNDRVRHEIIDALGRLKYRGAVPELTRIFDQAKPSDRVRPLILSALADIADPSSRSLFERFTADKNAELRLFADEGLARLADGPSATNVSADRLAERDARVRTAQAFALLRMGQLEYLDELVRGMGRVETRALAREYLIETREADRPLLFSKRDKSPVVRAELADVFGIIGDPAAMPALAELSRDPDTNVARAAERAIRRLSGVKREAIASGKASNQPAVP